MKPSFVVTGPDLPDGRRAGTIKAYRVAQLPLPDRLDRATTSSPTRQDGLVDGRPATGQTVPTTKEDKVAEEATGQKRSRSAKKADGAGTTTTATERAPAKKDEKGTDLMAALMQQVEAKVPGMKKATNKSQTMTRLIAANGKSFAVVFPPRKTGLAVKIPKQLLSVEGELPKGHGFHRTSWGLTRTITKASEAPKVAESFAVAAAAVTPSAEAQEDAS